MPCRVAHADAVSRWFLWRFLPVLAAIAVAGAARAAPRIALGPIRGTANPALVRQLRTELCDPFHCVPWSKVSRAAAPNPAKAHRVGVAGILTGRVVRQRGEPP